MHTSRRNFLISNREGAEGCHYIDMVVPGLTFGVRQSPSPAILLLGNEFSSIPYICTYQCAGAARTNDHRLGGSDKRLAFSQFWRLDI